MKTINILILNSILFCQNIEDSLQLEDIADLSSRARYNPRDTIIYINNYGPAYAIWDENTHYHEYGHYIMHVYVGNYIPISSSTGDVEWYKETDDPKKAYVEGWAEFFAMTVIDDPCLKSRTTNFGGLVNTWINHGETLSHWYRSCNESFYCDVELGQKVKARVCGTLWDLYDRDDDSQCNNHDQNVDRRILDIWEAISTQHYYPVIFSESINEHMPYSAYEFAHSLKMLSHGELTPNELEMFDGHKTIHPPSHKELFIELPYDYDLDTNFPNPFNSNTIIPYSVPKTSHVNIALYDILGREVKKLVNDEKEVGFHQVLWNGKNNSGQNSPSGVYFIVLISEDVSKTQKLVLLR